MRRALTVCLALAALFVAWLFATWPPPLWYRTHWPRQTAFMAIRAGDTVPVQYRPVPLDSIAPVLQDAVICGQDRDYAGLLGFPNVAACRQLAGDDGVRLGLSELLAHPAVVGTLREGLGRMNKQGKGSSMRIKRALLMAEPPSVDGHEITDKGYINQRATLERRKALVDRLYAGGEGVIEIG